MTLWEKFTTVLGAILGTKKPLQVAIQIPLGTGYTNPMPKWTYFSDEEVHGLDPELVSKLDSARKVAGIPFRLTSTTGGNHAPNSAHYKGLAVDIGLGDHADGFERDHARFLMVNALLDAGFRRLELCPLHVHVDIGPGPDYAQDIVILGQEA